MATRDRGLTLNRARYSFWSPVYDQVAGFSGPRRDAIERLALRAGERVLLVGVGTGLDLPLLPPGVDVTGIDLTPAMLARAARRAAPGTKLAVMDAQALDFADRSFDAVILHLILAVVPDGARCLAEAARVLAPEGRMSVFDKFLSDGAAPSFARRIANIPVRLLATDLNRSFGDLLHRSAAPLEIEENLAASWGGFFRRILLRRRGAS